MDQSNFVENEMSESVDESLWTEKTLLKFITKTNKINKDCLFIFFHLQNVSKSLDQQYNGILLIKVIKQSKRKTKKENHTFFLNSSSVDFLRVALSPFSVQTKTQKNTTTTIIRDLL